MNTRIPIKKYVVSATMESTLKWLEGDAPSSGGGIAVAKQVVEEYRKLEAHHKEETKFLIGRIEELEKIEEEFEIHLRATTEFLGR